MNSSLSYSAVKSQRARYITITSLIALILGHSMINFYSQNIVLNFAGLLITSLFIYQRTLRKGKIFSFMAVMYFCSIFPYLLQKGGGFNLVAFVCILFYVIQYKHLPFERRQNSSTFILFTFLILISCVLGWIVNYNGSGVDFLYSAVSFFGWMALFITASKLIWDREKIKTFIQINFVIIIYATIASLNIRYHFITIDTPMMVQVGWDHLNMFESGGLIGLSPYYGEHSLFLLILFSVFYFLQQDKAIIKNRLLIAGMVIAEINVFMSIARSSFILSIIGIIMVFLFQLRTTIIRPNRILAQITIVLILGIAILSFIHKAGLDFTLYRVNEIEEVNAEAGGISMENILNGTAINRETSTVLNKERYESKTSWFVGYGWGINENNRVAWFIDPTIKRISPHSQVLAFFFLFGWLGSVGYWGLIFWSIRKTYLISGRTDLPVENRVFPLFFTTIFCLFIFNAIKQDCILFPTYFGFTMILLGFAYSTTNSPITNLPVKNQQ